MVPDFFVQGLLDLGIATSGTENHLTLCHQGNLTFDKRVWLMFDFSLLEDVFASTLAK